VIIFYIVLMVICMFMKWGEDILVKLGVGWVLCSMLCIMFMGSLVLLRVVDVCVVWVVDFVCVLVVCWCSVWC